MTVSTHLVQLFRVDQITRKQSSGVNSIAGQESYKTFRTSNLRLKSAKGTPYTDPSVVTKKSIQESRDTELTQPNWREIIQFWKIYERIQLRLRVAAFRSRLQ